MKLEEIKPKQAVFYLSALEREFRVRPISLGDELWMKDRFGTELETLLSAGDLRAVCAIIFHQLEEEDKTAFKAQSVTIMDENGETEEMRLGGEKLLSSLVRGPVEKLDLYKALLTTIGISQPVEKVITDNVQKKSMALKKKTGRQSLK